MKRVFIGVIVVAVVVAAALGYYAYSNRTLTAVEPEESAFMEDLPEQVTQDPTTGEGETVELVALVDSEEEAEEIAEMYGITLSSYGFGVAVYTTDRDAGEVIREGIEKGYPELEVNQDRYELYDNN